jgi:hypothetical protein
MIKILVLFVFIINFLFVNTTFYLIAYDPLTKTWGQAAASSGFTRTLRPDWYQTYVKNIGMVFN